jgi:hypothetical protein
VAVLLEVLRMTVAHDQAQVLLSRNPAARAALNDPYAVARLLEELWEIGARHQVQVLADRAVTHVPLDNLPAVNLLLRQLHKAEAYDQLQVLLGRAAPADRTPPQMIPLAAAS